MKKPIKILQITKSLKKIKRTLTENHGTLLFTVVITIVFLGFFDAIATVIHITFKDIDELNPLMAYYIELGIGQFIIVKMFLTLVGLMTCIILKKRKEVKRALYLILVLYIVLTFGHYINMVINPTVTGSIP